MSLDVSKQITREVIRPEGHTPPSFPYSPGVKAGGWVFASQQMGGDLASGLAPGARANERNPHLKDPVELQSFALMKNLSEVLRSAGADISDDSVRIQQWRVASRPTMEEFEAGSTWTGLSVSPYYRARNSYIAEPRPASTGMGVRRLLMRDALIGVDMIAIHPDAGPGKSGVDVPEGVPSPLAGYSPAICNGDWVFLAGEIPTDWKGDWLSERYMGQPSSLAPEARVNPFFWYGSPIEVQTDYTLKKLDLIARAAGTDLARCVKANVYLGHPRDYEGMDRVWRQWFPDNPPARVVIPWTGHGGMGSRIEIDMVLLSSDSQLERKAIQTDAALEPLGHEPQAMRAGDFVFFSTQLPAGPEGIAPELLGNPELPFFFDPAALQAGRILDNIGAICEAAGTTIQNVCQLKEFHRDLGSFAAAREEWRSHFGDAAPASTTVELGADLIVPGCALLMEAIAYAPQV